VIILIVEKSIIHNNASLSAGIMGENKVRLDCTEVLYVLFIKW
tara:strand:+ start:215 stop:343 length:129 start_codon:yes stop_codon:yes gene_type:complete